MPLKSKLTSEEFEGLADALKEHYKEEGESYVLDAEGFADPAKLAEFRDSNRGLKRELDGLKKKFEKFGDLDPDKAREALAKLEEMGDDPPKPPKKPAGDPNDARIKSLEEKLAGMTTQLTEKDQKLDRKSVV